GQTVGREVRNDRPSQVSVSIRPAVFPITQVNPPCGRQRRFPRWFRQQNQSRLGNCASARLGIPGPSRPAVNEKRGDPMAVLRFRPADEGGSSHESRSTLALEESLELGEVVYYPVCPFSLPEGDERRFLLEQRLGNRAHKNISFDPHTGTAAGFRRQSADQA